MDMDYGTFAGLIALLVLVLVGVAAVRTWLHPQT